MAKNKSVGVHGTEEERGAKPRKKTECPISREQFREHAKPVTVKIAGGEERLMDNKEFSTGSLGWGLNDKGVMTIDGKPCKVQISINVTIIGSKELPGSVSAAE